MAEYKFVKELPDDYQCMICAKVLNEPHLTDCCGQHFCQACLEQWFKKQAKKICPHCRSETFTHMRYLPLKRKIDDLEVYCPNKKEGCKEITKLGELDAHKNRCGFAKIICTQGCRKSIPRKDLTWHCNKDANIVGR
jgi:TNF receptor-associated factor 4